MNIGEQITGKRRFENREDMFDIGIAAGFLVNEA
jgi:hypothetical protein